MSKITRRDLIKTGTAAAVTAVMAAGENVNASPATKTMIGVPFERRETVRVGIIGCGFRAYTMIRDFIGAGNVEIKALCDNVPANAARANEILEKLGQPKAELYTDGDFAYEKLCKRDDLDLIYIATPWEWHARQSIAAMENGKHVGVEVPMATTMKDIWKIVDVSEKTRRHCVMLENCCFNFNELLVLGMVRDGVFGELTHAEAAYIHDLRTIVFEDRSEGLWRRAWHTRENANFYPTHGLGPVANYLNINRGDKFDFMVSMSSREASFTAHRERTVPKDNAKWREKYIAGDMNTSLIRTAKGISIMLQHDVATPRPYDRINHIQGTKGAFRDFPARLFIDGQEGGHRWTDLSKVRDKYEHSLWKRLGEKARTGGHGGMDFIMCWTVINWFREGLVPDIDVYDGAAWTAPFPMSKDSVAKGSAPINFPDFTRGRWKEKRPTLI